MNIQNSLPIRNNEAEMRDTWLAETERLNIS